MTLTLQLDEQLEQRLTEEARTRGMSLEQYALRVLSGGAAGPSNGRELVDRWKAHGVIGSRTDLADSAAYARQLRREAEQRLKPR